MNCEISSGPILYRKGTLFHSYFLSSFAPFQSYGKIFFLSVFLRGFCFSLLLGGHFIPQLIAPSIARCVCGAQLKKKKTAMKKMTDSANV